MKTKKVWANLSVKDVEKTRKFYKELDFKPNEGNRQSKELASILVGEDEFVVHFFARNIFKSERGINSEIADLHQGNELLLTLSADSREEVDEWAKAAKDAGGTVFIEPGEIGEGWYGCGFADLDGHKWNVFYDENA